MVCKEDVLSWFKDLESYKRIDVMYELLNMCLPFELRYLGSCVEEIGKHTYQELRGPALQANDLEKLQKDTFFNGGILDENVRHRVLIYLSLLSSKNYNVADWMYKTLLRTEWLEDYIVKGSIKDDTIQSEFLLLYVMALHHPAFTFEQKLYFGKILSLLLDFKERSRLSPKPTPYGYPPGFGYPAFKQPCTDAPPTIPVKISSAMPCGDELMHQQPPTMIQGPIPSQEFLAWSRPGFTCGPPESVPPPFPGPTMSPLVSQSTSPIHSRSSSPHRTMVPIRTTQMPPPPPPPSGATTLPPSQLAQQQQQPPPPPLPCDPLPITSLPPPIEQLPSINNYPTFMYPTDNQIKMTTQQLDDELNSIPEEKLVGDLKQTNGLRFHHIPNNHQHPHHHHHHHHHHNHHHHNNNSNKTIVNHRNPYVIDQLQSLSLENSIGDNNCLQRSNSSSNSSLNQTPPETPTSTCRGGSGTGGSGGGGGGSDSNNIKPRCNGIPSSIITTATPSATTILGPMCEPTSPPPQQHTFNNSVPYTTYPTFAAIPTARNMFQYNTQQSYRSPFTCPTYQTYQNEQNSYQNPTYSLPYAYIYSGGSPYQQRNQNCCYNCGGNGHIGQECTGQNIEDITQKKTYTLEYSSTLPDSDNK